MVAWAYDDVIWGDTECQRKACSKPAELLYDGLPLCIGDADDLLERQQAIEITPAAAALLPDWRDV